jgi:hypothetical protein
MRFRFGFGLFAGLSLSLALAAAAPAYASPITDTFTGTIRTGTDTDNLFGGGSLVGHSFMATMTFDPSLLNYHLDAGDEFYTGGGNNAAAFVLQITVNNITVTSLNLAELVAQSAGTDTEFTIFGNSPSAVMVFYALGPWMAGVVNQPILLDPQRTDQNVYIGNDQFSITPGAVTATPEPASALILGAGLLALRGVRRRKQA